jgi:hypothetical protein
VRFDNLGAGFDIRVGIRRLGTHRCELVPGSVYGAPLLDSTTIVRTTSGKTDSVEFRLRCASGMVDLVVSGLPPGEQAGVLVDSPLDLVPYIGTIANGTTSLPVVPHAAVEIFPQPGHHAGTFYYAPRDTVVVRTGQTTTVPVVYAPQNGCTANQPIAWYRLDGTGADASGNGNDGTVSGATPAADRHGAAGAALSFDGVDDQVDLGDRFNTLELPFSVAAWVYQPNAAYGEFRSIFATDDETDVYAGMFFQTTPSGMGQISFADGGPVGVDHRRTLETVAPLPTDRWLHLVATVRSLSDMTLYVNGVRVSGVMSGTGGPPAHSAAPARIGAFQLVAANRPWLGLLDELRIYDCSLDAGEVSVLFGQP